MLFSIKSESVNAHVDIVVINVVKVISNCRILCVDINAVTGNLTCLYSRAFPAEVFEVVIVVFRVVITGVKLLSILHDIKSCSILILRFKVIIVRECFIKVASLNNLHAIYRSKILN